MQTHASLDMLLDALANTAAEQVIMALFDLMYPVNYNPETGSLRDPSLN